MLQEATDMEIKSVLDTHSKEDAVKYLLSSGFKEIGTGFYAGVYHKRGYKRLIKINKVMDRGGWSYAEYCRRNKGKNPYLPKIYYFSGTPKDYVIVMEYLRPLKKNEISEEDLEIIQYFQHKTIQGPNAIDSKFEYDNQGHKLYKLLDKLYKFMFRLDLKRSNIMVRPRNEQIVITDPLAW